MSHPTSSSGTGTLHNTVVHAQKDTVDTIQE